ncbi:Ca2+-binding RTX toxin-like protein [Caulobacter ginsengisoli]|uniref:Ca2+-binding RTX toxin-like protein n=1 Tax=Caulobacter ginsengisoli TaxID=400775 RepID=A0ABU0IXN6_9CAUL|nr:calcium-binding protein [Caulobacter ginsengisoli]MDQ0466776.1 Ca2+-binding RTX toxin-like protein [Caulobacter ginsengisoli]
MALITGTPDDDTLVGTSGDDTITGEGGNDSVSGAGGADVIDGGDGDDFLRGGAGDDTLIGGDGDDLFRGNAGTDSYDGGAGTDRVSFFDAASTQGVVADLRTGVIANDGFGNAETMTGIEDLGLGTRFADTFYGNDGANFMLVGGGDHIESFGGDDSFQVHDAPAFLDGGDGIDSITGFTQQRFVDLDSDGLADEDLTTNGVAVNLQSHLIQDDGFGGSGQIFNIENVAGSAGDDALIGDGAANRLDGLDGADILRGGGGNDVIHGGAGDDLQLVGDAGDDQIFGDEGDDLMRGNSGVDHYDGGDGFDRVSFFAMDATQGVVADLRTQTIANDGFGNAETMVSVEGLGAGTIFADLFHGDDSHNLLFVGKGDKGYGYGGDDTFVFNDAAALADGGDGIDTIDSFSEVRLIDANHDGIAEQDLATHGVVVDMSQNKILDDGWGGNGKIKNFENLGGSSFADTLIGDNGDNIVSGHDGDDVLSGDAGADTLQGELGADSLDGGKGEDRLIGGLGDDILTGGKDADVFVFGAGEGHDRVTDFKNNVDHIELSGIAGVDDFSDLFFSVVAGNVVVSWGTGDSIVLEGFTLAKVSADDFLFS